MGIHLAQGRQKLNELMSLSMKLSSRTTVTVARNHIAQISPLATLREQNFADVGELRSYLGSIPRDDVVSIQSELSGLERERASRYSGMKTLFHGAPNNVIKAIQSQGFKLTEGQRTGLFGNTKLVQNLALFLSEDKNLARGFGANRDPHGGSESGVLEVKADINQTLDMSNLPQLLAKLARRLVSEWEGRRVRQLRQEDLHWLMDSPEFVAAIKTDGYDSVRFAESTASKHALGLDATAGDTYVVFDPQRLHLIPPPLTSLNGLFLHLTQADL